LQRRTRAAANLRSYCGLACKILKLLGIISRLPESTTIVVDAPFSRGYTVAVSGVSLMASGAAARSARMLPAGAAEQRVGPDKSFASAALVSVYVWALYEANELDGGRGGVQPASRHHQRIHVAGLSNRGVHFNGPCA